MNVRVGLLVLCVAAACGSSGSTSGGTGGSSASGGGTAAAGGGTAATGGGTSATGGGSSATGGGTADAGTIVTCTAAIDECTVFEDHTDAGDSRTIQFGPNFAADPPCITVKVGQSVKFVTTATHPMGQICGPVNGVLAAPESATTSITMSTAGTFGYHCTVHNFKGAIQVTQ